MLDLEKIRQIREQTGMGILEIKQSLERADGSVEKALELLRKKGVEISQKKKDRIAREGLIESYIHSNKKIGVLVEISCETDFVSRSPEFKEFAHDIAMQVAASDLKDNEIEDLLSQNFIKNDAETIKDILEKQITKFGENIVIRRFIKMGVGELI